MGAECHLLELDYMGVQEHAVIDDFPLHISACHLLSSLNEFDRHLHMIDLELAHLQYVTSHY